MTKQYSEIQNYLYELSLLGKKRREIAPISIVGKVFNFLFETNWRLPKDD